MIGFFPKTVKDLLFQQKTSSINIWHMVLNTEAVARRRFVKKVFLQISENSQEKTCIGVSWVTDSDTGVFLWILRNL